MDNRAEQPKRSLAGLTEDRRGVAAIEYAVAAMLIGVAILAALGVLRTAVGNSWESTNSAVEASGTRFESD